MAITHSPARHLCAAVLAGQVTVTVGSEDVYVQPTDTDTDAAQFRVSLPGPVRRFISRFDSGEFRCLLPDHTDDPDDHDPKEV